MQIKLYSTADDNQLAHLTLPDVVTLNTEYQSGLVAVEGQPNWMSRWASNHARVDMGELVDAEYQPGKAPAGRLQLYRQCDCK